MMRNTRYDIKPNNVTKPAAILLKATFPINFPEINDAGERKRVII